MNVTKSAHPPACENPVGRRERTVLGAKGMRTRQRLLDAGAALLQRMSPVALTAAAVTRHAGMSPPSFYVYFDDVGDLVHALAQFANDDLDDVMGVLRQWREGGFSPRQGAAAFVEMFRAHWQAHRAILNFRNMEADRGEPRFLAMRQASGVRVIQELAALILAGTGRARLAAPPEATARATVVFAAIERLAAAEFLYPAAADMPTREQLVEAEVAILVELIAPV